MSRYSHITSFLKARERHISALALLVGFVSDNLLLPRVDSVAIYVVLGTYVCVAALLILVMQMIEGGHVRIPYIASKLLLFRTAIQFFFGALISALFVYYSRSGSVIESWPFLLLLLLLLVGNELAYKRYGRLWLQMSVLFFVLFMGMNFVLPVVLGSISAVIFLGSGLLALLAMLLFATVLSFVAPEVIKNDRYPVGILVGSIFVLMNILYFTHIIPPIPLSLRTAEVAHSVVRTGGEYLVTREARVSTPLWSIPTVHVIQGESLYFFSAVFAPTKLDTKIIHEWEYYNFTSNQWETRMTVTFPIVGGRAEGYRGYSIKSSPEVGEWRVVVRTSSGALIGRERFTVELVPIPAVTTEIRL